MKPTLWAYSFTRIHKILVGRIFISLKAIPLGVEFLNPKKLGAGIQAVKIENSVEETWNSKIPRVQPTHHCLETRNITNSYQEIFQRSGSMKFVQLHVDIVIDL